MTKSGISEGDDDHLQVKKSGEYYAYKSSYQPQTPKYF